MNTERSKLVNVKTSDGKNLAELEQPEVPDNLIDNITIYQCNTYIHMYIFRNVTF